jgi:hypothetical protein
MPTFQGRVEALIDVPSGVTVSASTGAHTSAVTVTLPEGTYYLTDAGGVDSLVDTLSTELNENVQGYPQSAAAMQAAVGYGTWSAGYLCNETSGDLAAVFGAPTLTDSGTPTYGTAGPIGGIDKAIGWADAADYFDGAVNFDVTNLQDLCVAWVGKFSATPSASVLFCKGAAAPLWAISIGTTGPYMEIYDPSGAATAQVSAYVGEWHVGMAVIDRSTGKMRVATHGLTSGTSSVSAEVTAVTGTLANAGAFRFGASATGGSASTVLNISAFYIGTGASAATGLSAGMATAIVNFASAVSAGWSIALSTTTGLITASNSFHPSYIQFTSTDLRSLLGFEGEFDYPSTAAQVAAALGYGTWTNGAAWLCNEASGDLVPVFGTGTLADAGTPTYSVLGARGGADKAVFLDAGADIFSGGDIFDTGATDDLAFFAVIRFPSAPTACVAFRKGVAGDAARWLIYPDGAGSLAMQLQSASGTTTISCTHPTTREWFAFGMALDRATGKVRIATQGLASGTAAISSLTTMPAETLANANDFAFGTHGSYGGTPNIEIAYAAIATGSGVATGLSANLSTALTSFAASLKSQTGTSQCKGLWFPDCPMSCDDDPRTAPVQNDLRQTISPTGQVFGLCGNERYEHTNIRWTHVPIDRYREASATYANASLEVFWRDTQAGTGHEFFSPSSPVQIYYDNAGAQTLVGSDESISGWYITEVGGIRTVAKKADANWTGLWTVAFPRLVSDG